MNFDKAGPGQQMTRKEIDMDDEHFKAAVAQSFRAGDERMERLEAAMAANTAKTDLTYDSTRELVEVMGAMKGGFKVLEWLAKIAKVVGAVVIGTGVVAKAMGWRWPWQ